MLTTDLQQAIEQLKERIGKPLSSIEVARYAVMKQVAAFNNVEMPEILDEKQRKVFMDNIDHLSGFLKSEDGADAIELVVDAYKHYCEKKDAECEDEEDPDDDDEKEGM